jgi:hypothetical protein
VCGSTSQHLLEITAHARTRARSQPLPLSSPPPGQRASPLRGGVHPLVRTRGLTRDLHLTAARAAQLLFFGGGTTGALTWATSTYVLEMHSVPGADAVLVTTPTLLGGTKHTEIAWASIGRPTGYHPFATFGANGSKYYLDELGEMHDPRVAEKLEAALNA